MCPETQQRTAGQVGIPPCSCNSWWFKVLVEAPPRGHICSLLTESKTCMGSPEDPEHQSLGVGVVCSWQWVGRGGSLGTVKLMFLLAWVLCLWWVAWPLGVGWLSPCAPISWSQCCHHLKA